MKTSFALLLAWGLAVVGYPVSARSDKCITHQKVTACAVRFTARYSPGDTVRFRLLWTVTLGVPDSVAITVTTTPSRGTLRTAYPRTTTRDTLAKLALIPVPAEGDTTRFTACFQTKKRGVLSSCVNLSALVVKPVDPGTVRPDSFTVGIQLLPDTLQVIREGGHVTYSVITFWGYADQTSSGRVTIETCDYTPRSMGFLTVMVQGNAAGTVIDSAPLRVLGTNEPANFQQFAVWDGSPWATANGGPPWPRRARSPALGESTTFPVFGSWICSLAGFTEDNSTRLSLRH